jgi:hypothetical protein
VTDAMNSIPLYSPCNPQKKKKKKRCAFCNPEIDFSFFLLKPKHEIKRNASELKGNPAIDAS